MEVGAGVSVGGSVVSIIVAEGITVSVGGTGTEVGDAHETIRKIQRNESKTLDVRCEGMEQILLDLGLSLNKYRQSKYPWRFRPIDRKK